VLTVVSHELQPGQVLAAPVPHPEHPGQTLLNRGYVVQASIIPRLMDMGIGCVFVDYPGLDDLDKFLAPQLSPERQKIYTDIKGAIEAAQRSTKPVVPFNNYYQSTRDMICTLMGSGQHPVFMEQIARLSSDSVGHATAVAHLALAVGIKLERYIIAERSRLSPSHAKETTNLGVAGMLHDLGKSRLPKPIQNLHVASQDVEPATRAEYEEHCRHGYDLIRDGCEATAASAVLHHHQRFDGKGFPVTKHDDGTQSIMDGRKIHVFARILAAADLFDRLCTTPDGKRRPNVEVLHLMRSTYAGAIDPNVLRVLPSVTPPYLPGSTVDLSDNTRAVVMNVNAGAPYFPSVRRMVDGKLDEKTVELSPKAGPQIASLNGVPLTKMLLGCEKPYDIAEAA
jgi:HD-GYP domain-containing protein (c-di-GMP phosphodiesterase class II)